MLHVVTVRGRDARAQAWGKENIDLFSIFRRNGRRKLATPRGIGRMPLPENGSTRPVMVTVIEPDTRCRIPSSSGITDKERLVLG